ncbi:hypothetical protein [Actinomyces wuliandei]|uniref:hypothetical protein n=1 Tax=Actinomyces wuliandei TaxID=2057743 RepID=UPI0015D5DB58|nr:hypothetical protein [Actinomyces wuliandei]
MNGTTPATDPVIEEARRTLADGPHQQQRLRERAETYIAHLLDENDLLTAVVHDLRRSLTHQAPGAQTSQDKIPSPDQEAEAQQHAIRVLRCAARATHHAYQQGYTDALTRAGRATGPAGRTDHPGPRPRATGPGRRSLLPEAARPSAVLDPADGTVLAHLHHDHAQADPADGTTAGPLQEVNGVTVQPVTRQHGRPTTYYVIRSHTPTSPLTRAETAHLARLLLSTITKETQ